MNITPFPRSPLPNWIMVPITCAFLFFFCWFMKERDFFLVVISVAAFVICLAELVQRLVEHFRNRRKP